MVKWGNYNIEDLLKVEKKIAVLVLMVVFIIILGTLTFVVLEGQSWSEAIFNTLASAVGYGFHSTTSRLTVIIASIIMILEWACLWTGFDVLLGFVTEGKVKEMLGGVKMKKKIDKMANHCILCGYGRVGSEVAKRLHGQKSDLVVIERDSHNARIAMEKGYMVIQGDVLSEDTLRAAGVERAKTLIAAMGSDADNVFVTLTARGINPSLRVVARAEREESVKKLKQAGASEVVLPSVIGGKAMADTILQGSK